MFATDKRTDQAYKYCMAISKSHYENFPVASKLLNKELRFAVSAVYAFARSADDFADEGDLSPAQRLDLLEEYTTELNQIKQELTHPAINNEQTDVTGSKNPIFIALADVIQRYKIPISLFYDLLEAFKQDVNIKRYNNFADILAYCQLSANPVGRILLYLNHSVTDDNLKYSDAICTALQLINFYQDIAQDITENNRLYLPLDEMRLYGISENDIKQQINNQHTQSLISKQLQRTEKLYQQGKPLCFNLQGRFALELRMIYAGGQLILEKLQQHTDSVYLRPRLNMIDKFKIIWRGFFPG